MIQPHAQCPGSGQGLIQRKDALGREYVEPAAEISQDAHSSSISVLGFRSSQNTPLKLCQRVIPSGPHAASQMRLPWTAALSMPSKGRQPMSFLVRLQSLPLGLDQAWGEKSSEESYRLPPMTHSLPSKATAAWWSRLPNPALAVISPSSRRLRCTRCR